MSSDYSPENRAPAPTSWGQAQGHIPSANVQATMTQMTTQLQTVIDAAERAAEAIRFDAEEQARHHLAEAQRKADRLTAERVGLISDLTDDLIRHASTVRDHSEQMIRALEDAISSVTTKLEQPALTESLDYPSSSPSPAASSTSFLGQSSLGAAAPASSYRPEPSVYTPPAADPAPAYRPAAEPAPSAAPVSTTPPQPAPPSEEALLHATRMAVAGNDRDTIARSLR
jgi:vacuolar-type H+-ATPase subunit H